MKPHHAGLTLTCVLGALGCNPAQATVAIGSPVYFFEFIEYPAGGVPFRQVGPATFVVPPAQIWGQEGVLQVGGNPWMQHLLGRNLQGLPAFVQAGAENGGRTFWASASTPFHGGPNRDIEGGAAYIQLSQSYIKDSPDATLTYNFSEGQLYLLNYGAARLGTLSAAADFTIRVQRFAPGMLPEALWEDSQQAMLLWDFGDSSDNEDDVWRGSTVRFSAEADATYPIWTWTCAACDGPGNGIAEMNLNNYVQQIDLSDLGVGEEFVVTFTLGARANDPLQGETFAEAYIRDPVKLGGSVGFDFTGLTPTNRGLQIAPVPEPDTWLLLAAGFSVLGLRLAARRRAANRGAPAD